MSSLRLTNGVRLRPLDSSDAPRVAKALCDLKFKRANLSVWDQGGKTCVRIYRSPEYEVLISAEDWRLIYPVFFWYHLTTDTNELESKLSPQPGPAWQSNRVSSAIPFKPDGVLKSYLDHMPIDRYNKVLEALAIMKAEPSFGVGLGNLDTRLKAIQTHYESVLSRLL